ncbi:MAG TPA: UDP-N-acetylmuramate dehydrogenase [Spirochaetota bacterium]|nr:UDP-N-acetylmuramate dehydrogenase [Spirochaetota bacterium]HPP51035.1 UDP-N-acetylmuramate dehydrogenase [Spirochaetota bacterium]
MGQTCSHDVIKELSQYGRLYVDVPMSQFTTFKVGGPADMLIEPCSNETIPYIVTIAKQTNTPVTIIGGGSNLVVGDRGIRGLVVRMGSSQEDEGSIAFDGTNVVVDAKVTKKRFVEEAIEHGLAGMEFIAGIPGCIGGGVIMNAGTTMGTFSDIITDITCYTADGTLLTVANTSLFSYRKSMLPEGAIVISARCTLNIADNPEDVKNTVKEILRERKNKHPLDYPSAGSVFKNPDGHASWKLINDAGLRGYSIGGAKVSELHTNFIVNTGKATAMDIKHLVEFIQETVHKLYDINLEPEIRFIGEF